MARLTCMAKTAALLLLSGFTQQYPLLISTSNDNHKRNGSVLSLFDLNSTFNFHHRLRGVRPPNAPPEERRENDSNIDSDYDEKESRNQKKREAKRAVLWGRRLAAFSTPQIKRILRIASLDEDVLDAIMLVKRLGPDVREGKRRQFNYIGFT